MSTKFPCYHLFYSYCTPSAQKINVIPTWKSVSYAWKYRHVHSRELNTSRGKQKPWRIHRFFVSIRRKRPKLFFSSRMMSQHGDDKEHRRFTYSGVPGSKERPSSEHWYVYVADIKGWWIIVRERTSIACIPDVFLGKRDAEHFVSLCTQWNIAISHLSDTVEHCLTEWRPPPNLRWCRAYSILTMFTRGQKYVKCRVLCRPEQMEYSNCQGSPRAHT